MGVLCLGATMVTATPASAGINIDWIKTTDAAPGGKARWIHNGDKLEVCDIESDGWAAQAKIVMTDGEIPWTTPLQDGGNDGKCKTASYSSMPEKKEIELTVCLDKSTTGPSYCRTAWGYS
jgi:hypothetical protein